MAPLASLAGAALRAIDERSVRGYAWRLRHLTSLTGAVHRARRPQVINKTGSRRSRDR